MLMGTGLRAMGIPMKQIDNAKSLCDSVCMKKPKPDNVRAVVTVDRKDLIALKRKLLDSGTTLSGWFREQLRGDLAEKPKVKR